MAVYLKDGKCSNWMELWGKVPVKLMVYITEVSEIIRINHKGLMKDLKGDLSVRLEAGDARVKSEDLPISQTVLNQYFFLDVSASRPTTNIMVTVKSGKNGICEGSLGQWGQLDADIGIEKTIELFFPMKERSKSSPADIGTRVLGKFTCRIVLTKANGMMETPPLWNGLTTVPPGSGFKECHFEDGDKDLRQSIKTGDLVVFQECDLLGHCMNLGTNSKYSRVGMVLRVPDRYTDRPHLYLVEFTSNPQRFLDIWKEEPAQGIVVFRLWERLRSIQGGSAWLLPLLEPLANDPLGNLIDFVKKSSSSPTPPADTIIGHPPADILYFLQEIGIKDPAAYREVLGAAMCAAFLRMGGRRIVDPALLITRASPKDPNGQSNFSTQPFFTPSYLISQNDTFGQLIPLRTEKQS